jgi:hypothetical protein
MINVIRLCVALLAACGLAAFGRSQAAAGDGFVFRDFIVDATVASYVPGGGIESYEMRGGMTSAQATLSLGFRVGEIGGFAEIRPRMDEGKFLVAIDVEPAEAKEALGFEAQTLDLTDVKPTALRLATDATGRVHQLNLTPSVRVVDRTPQPFDVDKLRLQNWRFPNSPVLVNDATYVGQISCAQSPVAMLGISGVANVEFSLLEMTDAQPWGVLQDGVVTLTHPEEHTTIQISNVSNGGPHALAVPGGPYVVWVRWKAPEFTFEEYLRKMSEIRDKLVAERGSAAGLEQLDEQLKREPKAWIYSSGVRGFHEGERVVEGEVAPLTISVQRAASGELAISVNDRPTNKEELAALVKTSGSAESQPVTLVCDPTLAYREVISVMDMLHAIGFRKIAIDTQHVE